MPYVERDKSGNIKGVYAWPNKKAKEELPADSADVQSFKNRLRPLSINLTESENIKLIDFYQANKIITAARAAKMRGQKND